MALDTSIPLQTNVPTFDAGQYIGLANEMQQYRQRQTQTRNQNALAQLLSDSRSYDAQGNLTQPAKLNMNSLDPRFAMQFRQQQLDAQLDQMKIDAAGDERKQRILEFKGVVATAAEKAREDKLKAGGTQEQALDAAIAVRNEMAKESGGLISNDEVNKITSQPYDQQIAAGLKRFAPGEIAEERLAQQAKTEEDRNKIAQDNLALRDRQEAERERADRAREDRLIAMVNARGTGKPPAGWEWDPNNPDTLRPIKGGPKDPDAIKPWAGREKVYTERILGSANQAATAIQNITELPVSASTGLLGIGGHSGGSLLSASFGALKNQMSSQEVQDYNVMLAGVKRNLAAIETMGLAPQGALTESMGSLELRPGDSNVTKLRKLAEMRQIVEKGMDVPLADPAIPPEIKSLATRVVDMVTKAVPYTQSDVTRLQRQGADNSKMTLEQLIKARGLGSRDSGTGDSRKFIEGQVYIDANGNLARYVKGKWVELN